MLNFEVKPVYPEVCERRAEQIDQAEKETNKEAAIIMYFLYQGLSTLGNLVGILVEIGTGDGD